MNVAELSLGSLLLGHGAHKAFAGRYAMYTYAQTGLAGHSEFSMRADSGACAFFT